VRGARSARSFFSELSTAMRELLALAQTREAMLAGAELRRCRPGRRDRGARVHRVPDLPRAGRRVLGRPVLPPADRRICSANHGFGLVELPNTLLAQTINGYPKLGEAFSLWFVLFTDKTWIELGVVWPLRG